MSHGSAPRIDNIEQVVYLKDVKANNTAGGTFTSGAWQTRDLNTVEKSNAAIDWVELSTNQFTLDPGVYEIIAEAPAYKVDGHATRLRNITDSTNDIIGSTEVSSNSNVVSTKSTLRGTIELSVSKTFEIQHQCQTTVSTDGFGSALGAFTVDNNIFTQVRIRRLELP